MPRTRGSGAAKQHAARKTSKAPAVPKPDVSLAAHLEAATLGQCLVDISKQGKHGYAEELNCMPRKLFLELCTALHEICMSAVQTIEQPGQEGDSEEQIIASLEAALGHIGGAAVLAYDMLNETHEQIPEPFMEMAITLHDRCMLALLDGGEDGAPSPALEAIVGHTARLCCRWWELNATGRELLFAQTGMYMLTKCMQGDAKAMDIKALYTIREGFTFLDYNDPDSRDLVAMLQRVPVLPAFLQRQEGRKFVSYIFRLHAPLIADFTVSIKNTIAGGKRAVLTAYGEILFRAWRDSIGGPFQFDIEADCIQQLMRSAIEVGPAPLSAAVRQVLAAFHSQKKQSEVDAMLCRLYEPIIFRAFGAANTNMRRNALLLLLDAFPIRDPAAPPEEVDECLSRQFKVLKSCLTDDCPVIRELAARGILKLLNAYWELIPTAAIGLLVNTLTSEVAFDSSWPGVRVAVIEAMTELIDNPFAQPLLEKALPQLAVLLSDPVLKVREAMAGLLVAVSRTRSLHFWDVVPIDNLLAVMAADAPSVSGPIQAMLVPSFFPDPKEGAMHVVNLLKNKPKAGQAFCRHLVSDFATLSANDEDGKDDETSAPLQSSGVPIEQVLSLVTALMGHMLATCTHLQDKEAEPAAKKAKGKKQAAKSKAGSKRRKQGDAPEEQADNDAEQDQQQPQDVQEAAEEVVQDEFETPATWASWATGLAYLAAGVAGAVESGAVKKRDVEALVDHDILELMYEASPNNEARCSIVRVASELPFLKASNNLRRLLIRDLSAGRAPVPSDDSSKLLLQTIVRCVCAATSGPKLVAMMLKAFKLRVPGTKHIPLSAAGKTAGGQEEEAGEEEDVLGDVRCGHCGSSDPEEELLMCDGCDNSYHMNCVQPAIEAIPTGDWFCHECEGELQASNMKAAEAVRCLEAMLGCKDGRELLHTHKALVPMVNWLNTQAGQQMNSLIRAITQLKANEASHVVVTNAKEATETAAPQPKAAAGSKKGKKGKKGKEPVVEEEENEETDVPVHVSHVTAVEVPSVATVTVFARTALHMALLAFLHFKDSHNSDDKQAKTRSSGKGEGGEDVANEDGGEEVMSEQQAELQDAMMAATKSLLDALDWCQEAMEMASDIPDMPVLATATTLGVACDVLGVLLDASNLMVLDLTLQGDMDQIRRLCSTYQAAVMLADQLLAAQQADAPGTRPQHVQLAKNTLLRVTQLCVQLVTATSQAQSHVDDAVAQQLEQRMDAEASFEPAVSREALDALNALATTVLGLLYTSTAEQCNLMSAAGMKGATAELLAGLSNAKCKVPKGWLTTLLSAAGQGVQHQLQQIQDDPAAQQQLQEGAPAPLADASNGIAHAKQGNKKRLTGPSMRKRKGRNAVQTAANNEDAENVPPAELQNSNEQQPSNKQNPTMAAVSEGLTHPITSMLLDTSQKESLQGQLIQAACASWQEDACVGALALLQRLGVHGLRARKLHLTGHEADMLIKLETLAAEIQAALQPSGTNAEELEGSLPTGDCTEQAHKVKPLLDMLLVG